MTLYSVYAHQHDAPVVVPDRFSVFAALLPLPYMLLNGLWLWALAFCLALTGLFVWAPVLGGAAAFWLYVLGAVLFGFEAATLRRVRLGRRGFAHAGDFVARDGDDALRVWLERR